jgi:WD40 repeat protein
VWRRKCSIIQDKYQSMRTLFDKDKFIGRPIREEENNINYTNNAKDQRKYNYPPSPNTYHNKLPPGHASVIDELNSMAEKLKSNFRGIKKSLNLIEESSPDEENKEVPEIDRSLSFTKYKWECLSTIDAHTSPILAIKNYKHMLISAATRNIRLWDLETNQMSSDITGLNLNSFVKALAVAPEKELLAASCDKLITLWDLRTSNSEGVLRGHKD